METGLHGVRRILCAGDAATDRVKRVTESDGAGEGGKRTKRSEKAWHQNEIFNAQSISQNTSISAQVLGKVMFPVLCSLRRMIDMGTIRADIVNWECLKTLLKVSGAAH